VYPSQWQLVFKHESLEILLGTLLRVEADHIVAWFFAHSYLSFRGPEIAFGFFDPFS
jgi:hypothetical protein